jgi:hypothetical protein
MLRRIALITFVALSLSLTACGSSTDAGSTASSSSAATPSAASGSSAVAAPASDDAITEWCNAYTVITTVLSEGTSGKAQAEKAILGLDRYADLWKAAGQGELLTPDEVNANLRAIAAYRTVLNAVAAGKPDSSPEVKAAKEHIRTVTEDDHDVLQSSAGKVLGYCGAPTASPSAPASATPSGS